MYVSEEENERLHQDNRRGLEQLAGSSQKQQAKEALREPLPPQVQFDLVPEVLGNPAKSG